MEATFFSANVRQCNIDISVVHVQVCFKSILFIIIVLLASQGSSKLKESVFVLPVGLYEWKVTTAYPMLTIMFKNILRTFEAEILKICKNNSASAQKLDVPIF